MPLTKTDQGFLKRLYKNPADEPLKPGSRFYEPVYEELGLEDPVQKIATLIDFEGSESLRLFSGFRGSGKTTELRRLRKRLERDGCFVLYADALNYVNAAEPVEITDLLMVIAGAFGDALQEQLGSDLATESFWQRAWTFLNSEVVFKEGTIKLGVDAPAAGLLGGLKTGLDLKFELKSATSFRRELRLALANKLKELKDSVDKFFEDGIKLIRRARGDDTQIVFIFDQLEQLRGTLQTEEIVIRSVERIFAVDIDLLRMPYLHMVFTVPPWLRFVRPGTVQITLLSTPHLWDNDVERTRCEPVWEVFRSLVRRRLGDDGLQRLFGDDAAQRIGVDALIAVCGGHFRDLLRMLRDLLVRAASLPRLPAPATLIPQVVNAARWDFVPVAQNDARLLAEIARARAGALPSTGAADVNRLARFLDSHFVLFFRNGDDWYDIHPLIREEVTAVLATVAPPGASAP